MDGRSDRGDDGLRLIPDYGFQRSDRHLCEQAIADKGETEFKATVDKLQWLLHERSKRCGFLLHSHVTLPEQDPQQKEAA